jgi:hypothetical protein
MSANVIAYVAVEEASERRRRTDRRAHDRRGVRRPLDTMFAATLVAQITPAEEVSTGGYEAPRHVRAGIAFDLKA